MRLAAPVQNPEVQDFAQASKRAETEANAIKAREALKKRAEEQKSRRNMKLEM